MKIAIVTIYDYFNHGNRLQNFALEQAITSLGHEVTSLNIISKNSYRFLFPLAGIFYPRMRVSKKWGKENLHSVVIDSYKNRQLQELGKQFDYVVVGSDQMFNPAYITNSNITFLRFVPREKRISYAPSFGVTKIDEKLLPDFKDGLLGIEKLSVREEDGAVLAKQICGRNAKVLVDPTMLLSKEQWQKFAPPKKLKQKYLLTYFLGSASKFKKKVKDIARKNNLKIVDLNNFFCKYHHKSPSEFVSLVGGAELVCTNSFHGHAFSIILERPFLSFDMNKKTRSRLENLLKTLNIQPRDYKQVSDADLFNLDYSQSKVNLASEREKGLQFLKNAFKESKHD